MRGPMMHCIDLLVQIAYSFVAVPVAATRFEQVAGQRFPGSPDWG